MRKDAIEDLKERLTIIAGYDPSSSIPQHRWEALRFGRPSIIAREATNAAKNLLELPLERLHEQYAEELISRHLGQLGDVLAKLSDPSELEQMQREELDRTYTLLERHTKGFADYIGPFMGSLMVRSGENGLWQVAADTKRMAEEVRQSRKAVNEQASHAKQAYEQVLEMARESSAKAAIGLHADKFEKQAKTLRERSNYWLIFSGALGVLSFVIALFVYFKLPQIVKGTESLSPYATLAGGTAIVAIFFSAAVWCGRIYRALVHQATVYEHRQLSLESFQLFVNGAASDETKDAVLLAAAHAAYGNVPTGLVNQSHREVPATPISQVFSNK